MEELKKVAEVHNLKNLLTKNPTEASHTEPLKTPPQPTVTSHQSFTPVASPLSGSSGMFYTKCDGCKEMERKVDKMEEELQRIKKAVQKVIKMNEIKIYQKKTQNGLR